MLKDIADGSALAALLVVLCLWAVVGQAVMGQPTPGERVPYGIVSTLDPGRP